MYHSDVATPTLGLSHNLNSTADVVCKSSPQSIKSGGPRREEIRHITQRTLGTRSRALFPSAEAEMLVMEPTAWLDTPHPARWTTLISRLRVSGGRREV